MKFEKEIKIDRLHRWTSMQNKHGVNLELSFKHLLDQKDMEKITTITQNKGKIKLTLEVEEPILDEEERKYLSGVIRPFRNEIKNIIKECYDDEKEFINIMFKDDDSMSFKNFKKGTMYKNMKLNKEYSLKDLEL